MKSIFNQIKDDPVLRGAYYPYENLKREEQETNFGNRNRFVKHAKGYNHWPSGRGIYKNKEETLSVCVNRHEHLQFACKEEGANVGQVLKCLNKLVNAIESKSNVKFERDERLGWLTFSLTALGTAMRASVYIKLPKISANREKFHQICDGLNLKVSEYHGEDSMNEDSVVYDLANKDLFGLTEFEAVKQMYDGVRSRQRPRKKEL